MNIDTYIRRNKTEDGFNESRQLKPATPTATLRGSRDRVEEYRRRVEQGEHLFSELDASDGITSQNERLFSYKVTSGRGMVRLKRGVS